MPATTTNPAAQPAIPVNYWHVHGVTVDADRKEIMIQYRLGFKGIDGKISILDNQAGVICSATPYMNLKPSGSKTWYINLRDIAYQVLKDQGVIPSDAVVT